MTTSTRCGPPNPNAGLNAANQARAVVAAGCETPAARRITPTLNVGSRDTKDAEVKALTDAFKADGEKDVTFTGPTITGVAIGPNPAGRAPVANQRQNSGPLIANGRSVFMTVASNDIALTSRDARITALLKSVAGTWVPVKITGTQVGSKIEVTRIEFGAGVPR